MFIQQFVDETAEWLNLAFFKINFLNVRISQFKSFGVKPIGVVTQIFVRDGVYPWLLGTLNYTKDSF